jgi:hypothetical protein
MSSKQDAETGLISHFCDRCKKQIEMKEPVIQLSVLTTWGDAKANVLICSECVQLVLCIDLREVEDA